MKKWIKTNKDGLEIKITEINSHHDELLKNFQACQEGSCDCPSDEYVKLENLDVQSSDNEMVLNLKSKKNQTFDTNEVEKCVDFVIKKVTENSKS